MSDITLVDALIKTLENPDNWNIKDGVFCHKATDITIVGRRRIYNPIGADVYLGWWDAVRLRRACAVMLRERKRLRKTRANETYKQVSKELVARLVESQFKDK